MFLTETVLTIAMTNNTRNYRREIRNMTKTNFIFFKVFICKLFPPFYSNQFQKSHFPPTPLFQSLTYISYFTIDSVQLIEAWKFNSRTFFHFQKTKNIQSVWNTTEQKNTKVQQRQTNMSYLTKKEEEIVATLIESCL